MLVLRNFIHFYAMRWALANCCFEPNISINSTQIHRCICFIVHNTKDAHTTIWQRNNIHATDCPLTSHLEYILLKFTNEVISMDGTHTHKKVVVEQKENFGRSVFWFNQYEKLIQAINCSLFVIRCIPQNTPNKMTLH